MARVVIRVDPEEASSAVVVRGDDDLVPFLKTTVADGKLHISSDVGKVPNLPLEVSVVVAELRGVHVSGAAEVIARGVQSNTFELSVSGAAKVEANGRVDRVDVKLSGAGSVLLHKLIARQARVAASGAGNIEVHATDKLRVSVSGAASVRFSGAPREVEQSVAGAGSIEPARAAKP